MKYHDNLAVAAKEHGLSLIPRRWAFVSLMPFSKLLS